jgi:hypothetical protein
MNFKARFPGYSGAIAVAIGLSLHLTGAPGLAGTNASTNTGTNAGTAADTNRTAAPDLPACYLRTPSGKLIDLTAKCGFIKPAVCATSLGSASRDAVVADFCRKNQRCALTNTCSTMPRGVSAPAPGTPMG